MICAAGQTLRFEGEPPWWVNLDIEHNRITVKPGVHFGATQEQANAKALAALAAWIAEKTALNELECVTGPDAYAAGTLESASEIVL